MALAGACRRSPAPPTLPEQLLDALNSHDAGRVVALFAPGGTFEEPGLPAALAGDALRDHLQHTWEQWRDQVYSARSVHTFPEGAVVEWTTQQSLRDQNVIELQGVTVLEVRDGRIDRMRTYFDVSPILRLLKPTRR